MKHRDAAEYHRFNLSLRDDDIDMLRRLVGDDGGTFSSTFRRLLRDEYRRRYGDTLPLAAPASPETDTTT